MRPTGERDVRDPPMTIKHHFFSLLVISNQVWPIWCCVRPVLCAPGISARGSSPSISRKSSWRKEGELGRRGRVPRSSPYGWQSPASTLHGLRGSERWPGCSGALSAGWPALTPIPRRSPNPCSHGRSGSSPTLTRRAAVSASVGTS